MTAHVLLVTSTSLDRVDSGKKVVLHGLLEYFTDRLGRDAVHLASCGRTVNANGAKWRIVTLPAPSLARRIWNILVHALILGNMSIQESLLYSPGAVTELEDVVAGIVPKCSRLIIIADMIRTSALVERLKLPVNGMRCLYLEDLLSLRYGVLASSHEMQMAAAGNGLFGEFRRHVPRVVGLAMRAGVLRKMLYRFESYLMRRREVATGRTFDRLLLLNDEEVDILRGWVKPSKVKKIKPVLIVPRSIVRRYTGSGEYLFLGALDYAPNAVAIDTFVAQVVPALRAVMPDFVLTVIGRRPAPSLIEAEARSCGAVRVVGFVDDLSPYFERVAGMVIPLLMGSGVKLKALQAMAHGVPVVATPVGVAGLGVKHGIECFVEERIDCFVGPLVMLRNRELNRSMSAAALAWYAQSNAADIVYREYDDIFGVSPSGVAPQS